MLPLITRGRNILHNNGKDPGGKEHWVYKWGFKFSVEKTNAVVFTKKRVVPNMSLLMYGKAFERVNVLRFFVILFDSKLIWDEETNVRKSLIS